MTELTMMVPASFWLDHCDRCPCDGDPEAAMAREVSTHGSRVMIAGTPAQIEVLRSDAAYYCDRDGPDECPPGLIRSARATLAAIARATTTQGEAK